MKLLIKSTLIKIRKSLGRFLSVLFIIALGMGFFAGIRETAPAMYDTVEEYYDKHKLLDIKIVSSLGLTDKDVTALKELKYSDKVIPSYSVDVLIKGKPVRMHAIEEEINLSKIIKGKNPENNNECLGSSDFFKLNKTYYFDGKNAEENLKIKSCKIVGLINSPLYVSTDKGISNVGNGKLEAFIFTPKDNFKYEVYSEIYMTAKNAYKAESNSSEYKKHYKKLYNELVNLKPIREAIRYEEVLEKAMNEINKIQNEVNTKINDAKNKLYNAKLELDSNQNKLNKGKKILEYNKTKLNENLTTNQQKINNGRITLNNNLNNLNNTVTNMGLNWETINTNISELNTNIKRLNEEISSLDETVPEYQIKVQTVKTLEEKLKTLQQLIQAKKQIETEINNLNANEKRLHLEIENGRRIIREKEIEIANNQQKINNGYLEYNKNLKKINEEEIDAERRIAEAKEDLKSIENPVWYLTSREENPGYLGFYNDAETIEKIARIFPLFFILIVALITLNTITRMIEEERTEIGIYKALGYSNSLVSLNYIFYIMLATIIGATIGLVTGYNVIPRVIYGIFRVNYVVPDLIINIKLIPFFIMIIVAITLLISVTLWACHKELKVLAAELLRPKAPKVGKNIFLEKITPFWKNISFTWKVTIRNIFRYKSRIIMTVIGVAGSTALLLAGFGLKDSIADISSLQFNNITKYKAKLYLNKDNKEIDTDCKKLLNTNHVINPILIREEAFSFKDIKNKSNNITLIVPKDTNEINTYIKLKEINTDKELVIPNHGVYITRKIAKLLNVSINDNIKIRDNNNKLYIIQVKGIVENYIMNYIYMSSDYYQLIFNKEVEYNSILADLTGADYENISKNLIKSDKIFAVNYTMENINYFKDLINNLNKIVYMIIASAAILAFIILYNLTSININERVREIATIKVLGFDDNEISTYVYRETYILSLIGIGVGLALGAGLHLFIIESAEPDYLVFIKSIKYHSYFYSVLMTLLFMYIVKIFTHHILKKIDMIESLKSVE